MVVLESMLQGQFPKLWAEAVNMACDVANVSVATLNENHVSPFQNEAAHDAPWEEFNHSARLGSCETNEAPTTRWKRAAFDASCWD